MPFAATSKKAKTAVSTRPLGTFPRVNAAAVCTAKLPFSRKLRNRFLSPPTGQGLYEPGPFVLRACAKTTFFEDFGARFVAHLIEIRPFRQSARQSGRLSVPENEV